MSELSDGALLALIGLGGGVALGLAARMGRFCTLGAIEDALYSSDDRRLRMWAVAVGVAIIGAHTAMSTGLLEGSETAYLDRVWNPLATVIGGLVSRSTLSTESKFPILGDIPIVGYVFRATSESTEKTTLEFHITPRIIQGPRGFQGGLSGG